jgi:methyl-accepting chemotaxis protein
MVGSIARVVGAVLLAAAVAGSFVVTRYLSLLEGGIDRDLASVDRIVVAEQAIQKQNDVLTDMVQVTNRIGQGMGGVLETSQAIAGRVQAVGEANRATLELNHALETNNGAAAAQLTAVVEHLKQMNASAAAIDQYLAALKGAAAGDVDALQAVAANTARMNIKTPKVVLP